MPPATTSLPKCPNCNSIIPPGKTKCISCGMEVAKMDEYRRAAAAAAAKSRGRTATLLSTERQGGEPDSDEPKAPRPWVMPAKIGGSVAAVALVLLAFVYFGGKTFAKPEPWRSLPTDPKEAASTYVKLVADDSNKASHARAYAMIAPSAKNPDDKHDSDLFLQYHHDIYLYLWSITLEPNWIDFTKVEPDPRSSDVYAVTIGPEVLHVQVVDQAPKDAQAKGIHHFAVMPFREIDPRSPARLASNPLEGAIGGLRMLGAGGAEGNIRDIAGMGSPRHETKMDRKMRILPLLNRPNSNFLDRHVAALWPIRTDPVVKWRLEQIVDDDRYIAEVRATAKGVLDGSLSEEKRVAYGVPDAL